MAISKLPGWLVASSVVSIGGFLNGFDTGSIGAVTTMPAFSESFGTLSATQLGLIVSSVMLGGGVPALFAGQLAGRFGAARVIAAGALVLLLGAALEACSTGLAILIAGRVIVGLGQGLLMTNVTVYICEISPSARRGTLVGASQMILTLGLVAGFFTCFATTRLSSAWAWRIPFLIQGGVALILVLSLRFVTPSPRWLLSQGRRDEAHAAVDRLSIPVAEAEKDIFRDSAEVQGARPPLRLWVFGSIFAPPVRTRTFTAIFLLAMVQLTGIDGVLFYAPLLFRQAGLSAGNATLLASGGSAIAIAAISIPAFLFADRIGRRLSLIGGGLGMVACMFVIGTLYETNSVHAGEGQGRWVVVALIFVFVLLYAGTWAMSAKLYAGEILAPETRLAANSLAQGINFFMNFLVSLVTPILLAGSSFAAYFLFGSLTLFTVIVCALFMPETRGLSLEAIHEGGVQSPGQAVAKRIRLLLRVIQQRR